MTVADMLATNARIYPHDPALIELRPSKGLRKEVSWKELDEQANRMANALLARGIGKGDRVLHLVMNSITWLETYFGVLRTGAWVAPLNFRFTSRDINYCADIAEARAMIVGEGFLERVEAVRPELSSVEHYFVAGPNPARGMEALEAVVAASPPDPTPIGLREEDECALYFTSGTTGDPKPILLTHQNLVCAATSENAHHRQVHDDNFILIPPLYHTGAKMHWFGSLAVGGRATLLTEFSPRNLFQAIHGERGTIVFLLVPWLQDVLRALESGELRMQDYDLSCWRLMHMGAQPIPPSLVRRWKGYFPWVQYDTNYGLGEASGPGCVHLGIENEAKVGAIGKPGFGWEARIVDDGGQDVPQGEVGELIVRGAGVMKGYYRNPRRTAEVIRDGWLYTGDLARMDGEGFIYLIDRKKDLIISGGENIFPVEVEWVLQGHPQVKDVAVIGLPDERLGEIAVAVVEVKPGQRLTAEDIDAFCAQNLPRYKRPRRIIFDQVPRNPTGKIEKPKLRQRYTGRAESLHP